MDMSYEVNTVKIMYGVKMFCNNDSNLYFI